MVAVKVTVSEEEQVLLEEQVITVAEAEAEAEAEPGDNEECVNTPSLRYLGKKSIPTQMRSPQSFPLRSL